MSEEASEVVPDEKDQDVTTCLMQLAERCLELNEPHTTAVLMTLVGARMGDGRSISGLSALSNYWAIKELERMDAEDDKEKTDQ